MLEQFTVENFKCFEKLTLDDLGHINIFVGKNNTGKTSLLQALALNGFITDLKNKNQNPHLRGDSVATIVHLPHLLPRDLTESVHNKTKNTIVNFESNKTPRHSLKLTDPLIMHGMTDSEVVFFEILHELGPFALLINSDLAAFKQESKQNTVFQHNALSFIPSSADFKQMASISFGETSRNEQKQLQKSLKDHVESKLDEIFHRPNGKLCITLESTGKEELELSLDSMGDGFSKLLSLGILLFKFKEQPFFIDEPENGFHYSVQSQFWQLLATAGLEHGKQSFIATHSYELLKNLDELLRNNPHLIKPKEEGGEGLKVRLYRLKRDKDLASIKVIKLNEDEIASIIEEGWELR